jgi:hypothetical protein
VAEAPGQRGGSSPRKFYRGLAERLIACIGDREAIVPSELAHVWRWFWALHARRSTGFAANPISYSEIAMWARLMGTRPTPFEVWLLTALDDALLTKKPADPEKSEAPVGDGPQAVAALFATLPGKKPKKGAARAGGDAGAHAGAHAAAKGKPVRTSGAGPD